MDKVVAVSLVWNKPYDLAVYWQYSYNDYIIWVAAIEAVWDPITFSVEFKQTNSDVKFHMELSGGGTFPVPYNLYQQGYYPRLSCRKNCSSVEITITFWQSFLY